MKLILMIMAVCLLAGCSNTSQTAQEKTVPQDTATQEAINTQKSGEPAKPSQSDKITPITLDKSALTTIAPKPTASYPYPFEADSQAVQNYAKTYNISPAQAQHAMTLAMASPEALNKVLDQIQGEYLGHSLTDGADMSLVVYTTDNVVGDKVDYVIADKFGEGLVLPVVITTKANADKMGLGKPQVAINSTHKAHTDSQPHDK